MPDLPQDPMAQLEAEVRRLREESAALMRELEKTKRKAAELELEAEANSSASVERP